MNRILIGLLLGLFAACIYDYRQKRIPNLLMVLLFAWGCGCACQQGGIFHLLEYVCLVGLVILSLFPFFRIGTIGAGDVKLLGVCAPFFPSDKILLFLFITMAVSAVISIFKMLYHKNFKERFWYLAQYISDCVSTKSWKPYYKNREKQVGATICMAGPVFVSILLYMGGIY